MDMYLLNEEFETVLKEDPLPNGFPALSDVPAEILERCKVTAYIHPHISPSRNMDLSVL